MAWNICHVQILVLFLLLATFSASLAAAQSPSAPSPSAPPAPSPSPGSGASPCSALADRCDWFFLGSGPGSPAPTLDLGSGSGEKAISPPIVHKNGQRVLAVNTNGGYTYTGPSGIPHDTQNQFYGNGAYVYVRSFNPPVSVNDYTGRCFLLPLTQIELGDGGNLNPADGNAAYLESRRCVVFATRGAQPGGSDRCWSPESLQAQWDAHAALVRERLRTALLEDAALAPSNDSDCAAGPAAQREFLDAAAELSQLVSDCHVNVSLFIYGQQLLEQNAVEAALQAEVLRDAAVGPHGRKLLWWGKRWLRQAKRAISAVKAVTVDPVWDYVVTPTADFVWPVIKAGACDVGCALVSTFEIGVLIQDCSNDGAGVNNARTCQESLNKLGSNSNTCFSSCQ